MKRRSIIAASVFILSLALVGEFAFADSYGYGRKYEITMTNITRGQIFSPPVVISHKWGFQLYELGTPAADWLYPLAEDGLTDPLTDHVSGLQSVLDYDVAPGPVLPGGSATLYVVAKGSFKYISVAAMLVSSNDAFLALTNKRVSRFGKTTAHAVAYDSGSEANSENCASIPGPPCGNGGVRDTAEAEGYVHVHAGIHGIGNLTPENHDGIENLTPENHDWNNPVAIVTIRPVR